MIRSWVIIILFLPGVLMLGLGVREVLRLRQLRRSGVRVSGVVVRIDSNDEAFFPVVSFAEPDGTLREFTSALGRGRVSGKHRVGSRVRVVYLAGRPNTAQLDGVGHNAAMVITYFGGGAVWLLGVLVLGTGIGGVTLSR